MRFLCALFMVLIVSSAWGQNEPITPDVTTITPDNVDQVVQLMRLGAGKRSSSQVNYSPDGRWIALASTIGIWVYETANLDAEPRLLLVTQGFIDKIIFSDDSKRLAGEVRYGNVQIWDTTTWEKIAYLRVDERVYHMQFSPDGSLIVTASRDATAKIWDTETGALLHTFHHDRSVINARFSHNMEHLITVTGYELEPFLYTNNTNAYLWDIATGEQIGMIETDYQIDDVWFLDDHTQVFINGASTYQVWQINGSLPMLTLQDIAPPAENALLTYQTIFSHDQSHFIRHHDNQIQVFEWSNPQIPEPILTLNGRYIDVIFSPDGSHFLTVERSEDRFKIVIRDVQTGAQLIEVIVPYFGLQLAKVVYSPDGHSFAIGANRGYAERFTIWDAQTGEIIHQAVIDNENTSVYRGAIYSPDDRLIASGGYSAEVELWDAVTGENLGRLFDDRNNLLRHHQFSANSRHLVIISYHEIGAITIWDMMTHEIIFTLEQTENTRYAISPDGVWLAFLDDDGMLSLYDFNQIRLSHSIPNQTRNIKWMTFSADSQQLVIYPEVATEQIEVWNIATQTGHFVENMPNIDPRAHLIESVYSRIQSQSDETQTTIAKHWFSPDGQLLITSTYESFYNNPMMHFWDAQTGEQLAILTGHSYPLTQLSFNSNGSKIITTANDGTIRIWGIPE